MRPLLSRLSLLPLAAVLGTGCLVSTGPDTPKDPCSPNPCTQGDKTLCVNEDGNARCLCKQGTVLRPSGVCEPITTANCPEHSGDSSEPDDCLSRAKVLATENASRQQSIEPVGDYDFFRIDGTLNTVYSVTVEPGQGSLMPRVDIFDKEGLWITSQDGRPKAQVGFKARATGAYYVRVSHSPMDASAATGLYSLAYSSLGQDDHGDASDKATTVVPDVGGATSPVDHYGRLEYGQDVDWFSIAVTQGSTYRIEFRTDRAVPSLAAYTAQDVKTPFLTTRNSYVEITAASTTTLYLALYSAQSEPGSYVFQAFRY
ncbi:hypothetical protein [Vitiosangium sp. GDMCC 1.1324]|uniref:hypothetical protein n=1 Tax=Vitiosangium sp. (strain GDMCC 1.1324) TaxID=2138576 RepID=UPI000D34F61C|nr:hypothetical protein [Vitiosangium sp. GDMCC 1.1324]PTL78297.1 hypothetical protein DAT35_40310 [Vitiosangium sp. GDMCC 1.1324]